jgi:predicted transcriptional regulator
MIGESGRIVIEVEPDLKRRLYSVLALEHQSLKDWFINRALEYVRSQQQPNLFAGREGEREL